MPEAGPWTKFQTSGALPSGPADIASGIKSSVPSGLVTQGNIDLTNRPKVANNGGYSTVYSMSFGTDQGEVLVPRVSDDGRIMSPEEAKQQYFRTGKSLGIFATPEAATAYAKSLHQDQAKMYGGGDTAGARWPLDQISARCAPGPARNAIGSLGLPTRLVGGPQTGRP
jgi:hypothetical protein